MISLPAARAGGRRGDRKMTKQTELSTKSFWTRVSDPELRAETGSAKG